MTANDHDAQETRTAAQPNAPVAEFDAAEAEALSPGQTVGRFTVLSCVGQGGMGQVFAAYDPALDRRIALKVLRSEGSLNDRERLAREAKALARLSDPNVVTVYEVAEHDQRLLIAMEYVEGRTLREWAKTPPGAADERFANALALLIQAGRGLLAAHEAGLIHRDFKPSNVLVGNDGRVRVADFGLAQAHGAARQPGAVSGSGSQRSTDASPVDARLTATGMAAGTPGYMAPEQRTAGPIDAKADQYSFCVTAWEILFGQRATDAGAVADAANPEQKALRSALGKGMRAQPGRRHQDMAALLAILQPHAAATPSRSSDATRRWLALSASAAVVLGMVLGGRWLWDARARGTCTALGDRIDEVWTAPAREALRVGMTGTGDAYGSFAADKVIPRLDAYAESWRQDTTAACMYESVHGTWDQDAGGRARWCLQDRLLHLSAFVTTMTQADAEGVRGAIQGAAGLPATQECIDRAALPDQTPAPPVAMLPALASLRSAVSRARALGTAGRYADGLEVIRQARAEAVGVTWGPLEATTLLTESVLQRQLGDHHAAAETGAAAYAAAVRADAWDIAATAATKQVEVVGDVQGKRAEGLLWAEMARLAMERAGDPFGLVQASYANALAALHRRAGNRQEAKRFATVALEQWRRGLGEGHPLVAHGLTGLAIANADLGEYALAEQRARQALQIYEETLGPNHPKVAECSADLGRYHLNQGEFDKGEAAILHALSIQESTGGGGELLTAHMRANLASAYFRKGDYGRALELHRNVLDIYGKVLGEEHPDFANGLTSLAVVLTAQGDHAEALPLLRRALAIGERTYGPNHVNHARVVYMLGMIYNDTQRPDEADPLLRQALRIYESNYGEEHPDLALPLDSLGRIALARGEIDEACALLERAVRVDTTSPPEATATTRFELARALWEKGEPASRERSLTLVGNVASDLEDGPDKREVLEWLAAHDPSTAR